VDKIVSNMSPFVIQTAVLGWACSEGSSVDCQLTGKFPVIEREKNWSLTSLFIIAVIMVVAVIGQ